MRNVVALFVLGMCVVMGVIILKRDVQPWQTPPPPPARVVVLTNLPEGLTRPLLAQIEQQTGVAIYTMHELPDAPGDGLVGRLNSATDKATVDLILAGELESLIRLGEQGQLAALAQDATPGALGTVSPFYRVVGISPRVLLVRSGEAGRVPATLADLLGPNHLRRAGLADPRLPTNRLTYALLAEQAGGDLNSVLGSGRAGSIMLHGRHSAVVRAMLSGQHAFALCNLADVMAAGPEALDPTRVQIRTLGNPPLANHAAVGRLVSAPSPEAADRVIEALLSQTVQRLLAAEPAWILPAHPDARRLVLSGNASTWPQAVRQADFSTAPVPASARSIESAPSAAHNLLRGQPSAPGN